MAVSLGPVKYTATRDDEGNREYGVTYKVEGTVSDGPNQISNAIGIPPIGATWTQGNVNPGGVFADVDLWAFCTPFLKVTPIISDDGEGVKFWYVDKKFSTAPIVRCQDKEVDNPLAEPDRISGSFIDGTKKVNKDKDGNSIVTTSFETVEIEIPQSLPTIVIEQNVLDLQLSTFAPMMKKVNSVPMWGVGTRTVRLASSSWQREFYGVCFKYYRRTFEFEIDLDTHDRDDIPDKGKHVIRGEWTSNGASYIIDSGASVSNPFDYIRATDYKGNPKEYFLDSADGAPAATETFLSPVQVAKEANFFTLGIPTVI